MPSELAISVLISGNGSNLQALIERQPDQGYRIAQVLSNNPSAHGLLRAQSAGIDTRTVDHRQYADRACFEQALRAALDHSCQLVLMAGFMRILSAGFLKALHCPVLNIHPALLPAFRGLDTHRRALEAGARHHGCTVHIATAELDSGPILAQAPLTIRPNDTEASLSKRVLHLEHQLYPWVVGLIAKGRLQLDGTAPRLDGTVLPPQGLQQNYGSDLPHEY